MAATRDDLVKLLQRLYMLQKGADPGWYLTRSVDPRNRAIKLMSDLEDLLKVEGVSTKPTQVEPEDEAPPRHTVETDMVDTGEPKLVSPSAGKRTAPAPIRASQATSPGGTSYVYNHGGKGDDRPAKDSAPTVKPGALLDLFRRNPGTVYSRAEVMARVTISVMDWNLGIAALVENGEVIRTGAKKGTRYQLAHP